MVKKKLGVINSTSKKTYESTRIFKDKHNTKSCNNIQGNQEIEPQKSTNKTPYAELNTSLPEIPRKESRRDSVLIN